jgi:hypothetical protein
MLHQPQAKIATRQSLDRPRDRIGLDIEAVHGGAAPGPEGTEGSVSAAEIEK